MPNLWVRDERVRRFVFARRFARVAAELMGAPGVRLYHDQALFKEPGGGKTPWHQDQFYWPLDPPHRRFDRDTWLAGCEPGKPAAGALNPVLYRG